MSVCYLDSSALVKLTVAEPETAAIRRWFAERAPATQLVTSELAVTEVLRAVVRAGGEPDAALAVVDSVSHVALDRSLLVAAGRLRPPTLRSLDAIHLAAAMLFEGDLEVVVTYDERMIVAAVQLDLPTLTPA